MSTETFWNEMQDVHAAMFGVGAARHVPMSPYADEGSGSIWFITAQGTDLVEAAARPSEASLIVTGSGDFHARVEGTAVGVENRAKLEELWNPIAGSWFDGIDDPDIRLIRFTPRTAEVWTTSGAVGLVVQVAKAKLTGEKPDMGETFTLTF